MADNPTIVVVPPTNANNSDNSSTTPLSETQLSQATEYGAMREAFQQTQNEVASTRSVLQEVMTRQESFQTTAQQVQQQHNRILELLEKQESKEVMPENPEVTVITPPTPQPETVSETPKKKQSRLSRLLFGKEDDE